MPELLEISGLKVAARGKPILEGVDLRLRERECFGLVGESGSGKSMTALALMGLLPPGLSITEGAIHFQGTELRGLSEEAYREFRGSQVGMVFQEPFSSLNPVLNIAAQVAETLELHRGLKKDEALHEARFWLERVGIPDAQAKSRQYPHQWSGGMRQRAMIAMALACRPRLLIADEPTTALDVTVQAQILGLLKGLSKELGISLLMISHDLGVIHEMADTVAVMRHGKVVEAGPKEAVFFRPQHEYTRMLLSSYADWASA